MGFTASKDEVFLIFRDHNAHKTGYLPMDEFYARLRCWTNYKPKDYDAALKEEKAQLLERANEAKKRPTTAVVAGARGLRSLQQKSQSRLESASRPKNEGKPPAEDKTKHYLKMAKIKREEEERELALTIDKGKRESEFDCLHKMSEACEFAKALGIPLSFSTF